VAPPPSPQDPRPQPTLVSSSSTRRSYTIQAADLASTIPKTWAAVEAQRIIRAAVAVIGDPRRRLTPATMAVITPAGAVAAATRAEEATTILCMVEVDRTTWVACSSTNSTTTIINNSKEIQTWDHGHNKTINEIIRKKEKISKVYFWPCY